MENNPILSADISDRRGSEIPNYRREDLGCVVRYTPLQADADGFVCFTRISGSQLDREIKAQCEYFGRKGLDFEWKVYDVDGPSNLIQRLIDFRFEQGDEEALMVYDLARSPVPECRDIQDITVREVTSDEDLEGIVRVQQTVWHQGLPWLREHLTSTRDNTAYFCAFDRDTPIATGWIEYPKGSLFAELHGGSVQPEYRGRGIYTELLRVRLEHARAKGIPYISVDAAPMSRPILESKGFTKLCSTYPLKMKTAHQGADQAGDYPRGGG